MSSPEIEIHDALCRRDAGDVRRLLEQHPGLRGRINDPIFSFNSPAIVAFAEDPRRSASPNVRDHPGIVSSLDA
jgi:hypothetical protein